MIRKAIHWATAKDLWPKLWKTTPRIFFYLYPSKDVSSVEFEKKWVPDFMPRNELKGHPQFGWRDEWEGKKLVAAHFNSGVSIYFKTYTQDVHNLQTGTCHAIFCDEELPMEIYPELRLRLAATQGYFITCFTATRNQDFWRRAIEPRDSKEEVLPDAFKIQVSMYDCLTYEDGTPGAFTEQQIERIKQQCGTQAEVLRRVYGRFVADEGRKFPAFDPDRHFISKFHLKPEHKIYAGVDIGGGGGGRGHPAAIVFVALEPDFQRGTIFRGWRGDNELTTAGDIFQKFKELRGNMHCLNVAYDYSAKDFGTIAARSGESFQKADKSKDSGEDLVNTLFRNDMLMIVEDDELRKLGGELLSLMKGEAKSNAKDDFADALRYALMHVPFDWAVLSRIDYYQEEPIESRLLNAAELREWEMDQRRGVTRNPQQANWETELDQEFEEWNGLYGAGSDD